MELALPFINLAYEQCIGEDALVVIGRGLGARALFCRCVQSFCGLTSRETPILVIVIGFSDNNAEAKARAQVMVDMIEASGTLRTHLPVILNAGASKTVRKAIYEKGGVVFAVSPQVILQDSQGGKDSNNSQRNLDLRKVDGIMVWRAEEARGSDKVQWLMRKFKECNPRGFVKAFSEDPESLTEGFVAVEKLMLDLKVKKLQLWPRFNQHVVEDLSSRTLCHEYTQAQTHLMLSIQRGIAECMDSCIKEIKTTSGVDTDDLTIEKSLFTNFNAILQRRMAQNGIPQRTESALHGLKALRKLMEAMTRTDCVGFYSFLDSLKPAQGGQNPWLNTPAGERLIQAAQQRLFSIEEIPFEFASHSSKASSSMSRGESYAINVRVGVEALTGPSELIIEELQTSQGFGQKTTKKSFPKRFKLKLILEQNPKIKLLRHVISDMKTQWDNVLEKASKGSHDTSSASDMLHMDAPGAVALVACKDEDSCYRLKDALRSSADFLEHKLYRFLIHRVDESKVAREAVLNAYGIPLAAPAERGGTGSPWFSDEDVLGSLDPLIRQLLLAADLPALDVADVRRIRGRIFKAPQAPLGSGSSAGMTCPFIPSERRLLWKLLAFLRHRLGLGIGSPIETTLTTTSTSTSTTTTRSFETDDNEKSNLISKDNDSSLSGQPPKKIPRTNTNTIEQVDNSLVLEILPRLSLVFYPISSVEDIYPVLADLRPNFVALYDPSLAFLRDAEVYSRTIAPELYATYMLTYSSSSEEGQYMNKIKSEKAAFERLIAEKSRLVQPATVMTGSGTIGVETSIIGTNRMDAWGINTSEEGYGVRTGMHTGISDAVAILGAGSSDSTDLIRRQDAEMESHRPRIIVDMRETRSSLPNMIDKSGISVNLVTISVGDYILSPDVCVERKSISDLIGSLISGRMFTQVENMLRYYSTVVLLIECDPRKQFLLVDIIPNANQIEEREVRSQLTLLIMTYPKLRLVWSRSPECTVALFRDIKQGKPEPSADEAVSRGRQTAIDSDESGLDMNDDKASRHRDNRNHQAIDLLRKLPGITSSNIENVIAKITSLVDLAHTSAEKIESLIGKENGKLLYSFLHSKRAIEAPPLKKVSQNYSFAQYVTVGNENDKLLFDAQIEVSVFDPGQDSFVSVPDISDIVNLYGTSANTEQRRNEAMSRPQVDLYDISTSNDPWIQMYGNSGTYQLSYPVTVPSMTGLFMPIQRTSRNTYLSYFQGNLWIIGAWAFCPGPPWVDFISEPNVMNMRQCTLETWSIEATQPWINQSLGNPHSYVRGVAGVSRDGGKSWNIAVADPRLARLGSELVVVNGSDGSAGAAMCLVGGTIIHADSLLNLRRPFLISDSVLCTYDGSSWWENTPLPTPSAEHTLVSIGSSILVVGGLRPESNATPGELSLSQDYMVNPPLLLSVLSTSPCKQGNPTGQACIGFMGWAAFLPPPLSRLSNDFRPRCRLIANFLPGRGTGSVTTDTKNFVPSLKIGGGKILYKVEVLQVDSLLDMYYIASDSLVSDIDSLALISFNSNPLAGMYDTFNNSIVSFMNLGSWTQVEGQVPQATNFGNTFYHQIVFAPDVNPCISNGIFTTMCDFPLSMPLYVFLSSQTLSLNYERYALSSTSLLPATHLTTEPLYSRSIDALESYYGQRVSELPNFGSGKLTKSSDLVTDSILIAPEWNEGQPIIFLLQGGQRLLAAHFARCYFPTCTQGEEYPVTCQHTPRDSYCTSCQVCTGNTSDTGTFTRRECSFEISPFSRVPSVLDTVCDPCTNCTDQNADFLQTCSIWSDATCTAKSAPAPSSPVSPSTSIPKEEEHSWKIWLFRIIPLDRQIGPFLEILSTRPLENGVFFMAILTLIFVMCLSFISIPSVTAVTAGTKSETPSSLSHFDERNVSSNESTVSLKSLGTSGSKGDKMFWLCFAYAGILFIVSSESYVFSLPDMFFAVFSIFVHVGCGLGVMILKGYMFNSSKRRLASSPEKEYSRPINTRFSVYFLFFFLITSPLCIGLLAFIPHDLDYKEVKKVELIAAFFGLGNSLFQIALIMMSVFWYELSLFLWPIFLSLLLAVISLACSIYLVHTRINRRKLDSIKTELPTIMLPDEEIHTDSTSTATTTSYDSQITSNAVTVHNSNDSVSSNDLETRSVVESVDTEMDTYSLERTHGLNQIEIFALNCNAEDVTSFSELSDKEKKDISRLLFMKNNPPRRSSAQL